jgi:hypothetical protein
VPDDDGEQVVEVVRHAAGKSADRLHLLRLVELLFEPLPLVTLAPQLLVCRLQLGGPRPDQILELIAMLAQLVLCPLPLGHIARDDDASSLASGAVAQP